MTPRKISIVTETYVPDVNGVAISLRHLIDALVRQGVAIQLIRTRPRSAWTPVVEEIGCPGITIPMYPELQMGLPSRRRIEAAWDSFKPDLVYLATEGLLGNSGLKVAMRRKIPVLSAFHTNFHRYSSYYGLGWIKTLTLSWLRRFHNRTGGTLVPSDEIADLLQQEAFERVQVLPHGVDCDLFSPQKRSETLRESWGVTPDQQVLLYVGRIAAEKNIPLAIAAYEKARAANPELKFVLVGDGPLRDSLEKEHPEIEFAGVQTGETLSQYFASADAFVFPSVTETFGLVTLEAMASALPVVAFDMAAAHKFVESGSEGVVAEVDNDDAFIEALESLLSSDISQLGRQARIKAESLSWDAVATQFISIIEDELKRRGQASSSTLRTLV